MIEIVNVNPAIWKDGQLLNAATCDRDENGNPLSHQERLNKEKQYRLRLTKNEHEQLIAASKKLRISSAALIRLALIEFYSRHLQKEAKNED